MIFTTIEKYAIGFALGVALTLIMLYSINPTFNVPCVQEQITDTVYVDTLKKYRATNYRPNKKECDKEFLITASGYKIDTNKLKRKEIRIVGLSRDLLKKYPLGSNIYVYKPLHLKGYWKVEDKGNKRLRKTIDFLSYTHLGVDSVLIL